MGDPNWADQLTAWGTLAYTVLTGGIAAAAFWAAFSARKQLRVAEQSATNALAESQLARLDAVRPVVVVPGAVLAWPAADDARRAVRLTLENVGTGPAMDATATVWIEPMPPGLRPGLVDAWRQAVLDAENRMREREPDGSVRLVAVAAGSRQRSFVIGMNNESLFETLEGRDAAFAFVHLQYSDLHGRRFEYPSPSAPGRTAYVRRQAILDTTAVFEPERG
jgi:hypothetical protein